MIQKWNETYRSGWWLEWKLLPCGWRNAPSSAELFTFADCFQKLRCDVQPIIIQLFPEELGKLVVDEQPKVSVEIEQQPADDKTYASLDVVTLKPVANLQGTQSHQIWEKCPAGVKFFAGLRVQIWVGVYNLCMCQFLCSKNYLIVLWGWFSPIFNLQKAFPVWGFKWNCSKELGVAWWVTW